MSNATVVENPREDLKIQAENGAVPSKESKIRETLLEEWSNNAELYGEKDVKIFTGDSYVKRYLRKHNGDEVKAIDSMRECLKWRKETGLSDGNDAMVPLEFYKIGAVFPYNEDLDGNPILFLRVKFYKKVPELKQPLESFVFYNMFKVDEIGWNKGEDFGWVLFFDITDVSLSQYDIPFLIYVLQSIHKYFPHGLKKIIFYNLPWLLKGAVKIVRNALPKELNDVVQLMNKDEIFKFAAKDSLPKCLGGNCTKNIRAHPEGVRSVKVIAMEQYERYKVTEKRVDEILKIYEPLFVED